MTTPASLEPRQSLSFRDSRPPHEIQAAFERMWINVLTPTLTHDQLHYTTSTHFLGTPYSFVIQYEGRSFWKHIYTLHVTTHLTRVSPDNIEFSRKNSRSWFDFWTSKLDACDPALSNQVHTLPYSKTVQEALSYEAILDSTSTLQQLILSALQEGKIFHTSHKEGGTQITCQSGTFYSSNYGESTDYQSFSDPQGFLQYLFQFYHGTITHSYHPAQPTEYQIWRLIYRMLQKR